jgi:hypothetical protein
LLLLSEVARLAPSVSPQPRESISEGQEEEEGQEHLIPTGRVRSELSLEKAIRNLGATALKAIDKELAQMEEKLVYTPIKFIPIPSSMFVTEKKDPMGWDHRTMQGSLRCWRLKDPSRSLYSPILEAHHPRNNRIRVTICREMT